MAHSRPTGRFSYDTLSGKWEWDDEVFRIHGLEPGSVTPDTELVLASKHPDDRERVARLIEEVSRTGVAFSISYRILLGDGTDRRVVLVGEGQFGAEEQPTRVEGFYIDLTPDFAEENEEYAKQAVAASAQSRAAIEQAKGALMLSYGLDPDQAFAMLRWWSRNRNVKVRDLAERIVVLATEGEATDEGLRRSIDSALHDLTE
jgi:PAS domain-containing protein